MTEVVLPCTSSVVVIIPPEHETSFSYGAGMVLSHIVITDKPSVEQDMRVVIIRPENDTIFGHRAGVVVTHNVFTNRHSLGQEQAIRVANKILYAQLHSETCLKVRR